MGSVLENACGAGKYCFPEQLGLEGLMKTAVCVCVCMCVCVCVCVGVCVCVTSWQ